MSDTFEKVKEVVVEHLGVEPEKVVPEAKFMDDLGGDSLDLVQLIMSFEDTFDIKIPDEDAEHIFTIADAITYIENKQKG